MEEQNNNQINPVMPPAAPVVVSPQIPESSNKNLFILIGCGLVILIVLGGVLFYYMSSRPTSKIASNTQDVPAAATEQVKSSVTSVKGASDLDQLLTEVNAADDSLDKELITLGKDSSF